MINQLDVASIGHNIFSRMKRATLDLQVIVEHVLKLSEWQWFGQKKLNPVHVKMCVSALKTNSRLHPYWGAID